MLCRVKTMKLYVVLNVQCNGMSLRMLKYAGHLSMAQYQDAEHRRCSSNVYARISWLHACIKIVHVRAKHEMSKSLSKTFLLTID